LKFKNAFVNGRIVPIDHTLKTGDIVDIHTFKNKYSATASWGKYLHTPSAKAKLNRFIRQEQKDVIFKEVSLVINNKLKEFKLPLLGAKDDKIGKKWKGDEYDRLLLKIRDKQLSITKLIKEVYKETLKDLQTDIEQPVKKVAK
jgi:GTP pyrophosphokinase